MENDRIVVYQTFSDPIEANIVKGLLDAHEIECYLSDENTITLNPLYCNAIGGIKLNVFERDTDKIASILKSENSPIAYDEPLEAEKGKVICPKCHSDNVSYGGSVKRKFGYLDILIAIALMVYPFTQRKAYHCFNCNHEFKIR
jgi:Zn finger protein HypA/HybF involved in hydrogenase expression